MPIPGNLLTTAMAVMPHRDPQRALRAALSLDVPFWPQLPHLSYREDMYVQASEHFPGMVVDMEARTLRFSTDRFMAELEGALARMDDLAWWDIGPEASAVYRRFCEMDHSVRPAIRGQLEGPVSFALAVTDENDRPLAANDEARAFLIDVFARRVNAQLSRLAALNPNAFMFIDEPGLQFVFSALSGYAEAAARADLEAFFAQVERPRGVHLCGNPDWDFLLSLDLDVLSLDIYRNAEVFAAYAPAVRRFLDRGGRLVWGIVPTQSELFGAEGLDALEARLLSFWETIASRGVDRDLMLSRSMLSPATCCLVNPDGEATVEAAFAATIALSRRLQERFRLPAPPPPATHPHMTEEHP